MITSKSRLGVRLSLAAAGAAMAFLLAACGADEPSEPAPSTPPTQISPDRTGRTLPTPTTDPEITADPLETMRAMCDAVFTRDAATEQSYSDSYRRAKALMTPQLEQTLLKQTGRTRPFPQWVQWQQQHAWIAGTCKVTTSEHPVDTRTTVSRILEVTETVEPAQTMCQPDDMACAPESGTAEHKDWVVYATATQTSDGWRVSQFNVSPS